MPNGDMTGPDGKGPMTGRKQGYCSDENRPDYTSVRPRLGRFRRQRFGFGAGRGRQRRVFDDYPEE